MVKPIIAPPELATPVAAAVGAAVPDPDALVVFEPLEPPLDIPVLLPVLLLVLLEGDADEVLFDEIPSPPEVLLTTAGQVKLNKGVVESPDVMANLASLSGLESLKLYHQTLVFPKSWHPTVSQ